jgi:DNA-binding winged helix-turn-helix (wHTH) protein
MAELRRALDDNPTSPYYIETISGEGYRFIPSVHGEG